ncbi:MAG: hypothetical protein LUB61_00300 [Eggerthellaceae bacterium]|nr:hypothetical protein [Eggerthellaceae bacterium]
MSTDFGEDSGTLLFDWMVKLGENSGRTAMRYAMNALINAFKKTNEEIEVPSRNETAKVSMSDFEKIKSYPEIRSYMNSEFERHGIDARIEHEDEGDVLIFKTKDAKKLSVLIKNLGDEAADSLEISMSEPNMLIDIEPLEKRCKDAELGAEELNRAKTQDLHRSIDRER